MCIRDRGDARGLAAQHEYVHFSTVNPTHLKTIAHAFERDKEGAEVILAEAARLVEDADGRVTETLKEKFKKWVKKTKFSGGTTAYHLLDENGDVYRLVSMAWPNKKKAPKEYFEPLIHPTTEQPCPVPRRGWRNPPDTMKELIAADRIEFGVDETTVPNRRYYLKENLTENVASVYYYGGSDDDMFEDMDLGFDNPKPVNVAQDMILASARPRTAQVLDYFAGSGTTGHAVLELNREDNDKEEGTGRRKWILVEMGEYFESVTKPRMQKVVHSRKWKDGKPVEREGISQCFKTIRLESYEDVLNNLQVHKASAELFGNGKDGFAEDHLLHYALDVESRESLLNVRSFADPFNYRLRITRHNEIQEERIDLVETFNYLIGLVVHHCQWMSGFHVVTGALLSGEKVLIIWRNTTEKDNTALEAFFKKRQYNPRDTEFDLIYVNGDNTLENLRTEPEHWKVRLIEEEFLKRMWEGKDV